MPCGIGGSAIQRLDSPVLMVGLAGPAHTVDGVIEVNREKALAGGVVSG